MENTRTLQRHCFDGICHCDWRLTLTNCSESQQLWNIQLSHVVFASISVCLGIVLLVYRIATNNFQFWNWSPTAFGGYYRPRPVEAVIVFCTILEILRIVNVVYLMFDIAPESIIPRTFMFDFPWQFGYGGLLIFVINIAQSVAQNRNLGAEWLPSFPFAVDIFGGTLFVTPFVINNILTITSGAIHNTHLRTAEILQRLLYISWSLYTGILTVTVIYSGTRLIRILKSRSRSAHDRSQASGMISKVLGSMIVFSISLGGFAIFLLAFGLLRDHIIASPTGNMILSCIWNYWGDFSTFFAMLAVSFSPKTIPGLSSSKSKDTDGSTTRDGGATTIEDTRLGGATTLSAVTTRFQNDYDAIWNAIKNGRMDQTGKHSWKKLHTRQNSEASEIKPTPPTDN